MGVCGGCDTPPENKLSANEGICRQTKNNIPQNVKLNRDIQQNSPQRHKKVFSGGIPPPPPCTGHYQSCQVSRFTRESPGFRADLQVSRLVLKISRIPLKWSFMHGLAPPPQVCWANKASRTIFASQSGNIGL